MILTRSCPAKVNLFLEVTGKRPNGYHELATLFAKINWADLLTIDAQPADTTSISLTLGGPIGKRLRADETNLVCRATRGFLEHFNLQAKVEISLEKNIPTGAGLGGGSSDAAYTLLMLCEMFGKDFHELLPFAATLGADVPLFMYPDTFLKGEGIGEILTPVTAAGNLPWLVLIYPNAFISTKMVFGNFQLPPAEEVTANVTRLDKLINCLQTASPVETWEPFLFNRLEKGVAALSKPVEEALADLKAAGANGVMMSGSGSTVFGLVSTREEAQRLTNGLRRSGRRVFYTSFYTPKK